MPEPQNPPPVPPLVGLLFAILAVSTASVMIRLAQQDMPSLLIAAGRLGLATLILAPFAWRRRGEIGALAPRALALLALSGLFLAVHFAAWISSLAYTSVASSVVLVSTTPLWVALFAPLFLGERLPRPVVVGLVVALLGSVLVGGQEGGFSLELVRGRALFGNLLALAGALAACGYLLVGRRLRAGLSLVSYTFLVYGTAALALWLGVAVAGLPVGGYAPGSYLLLLALALVPQLLGHSTFNWALRYLSAAYVSVSMLGEPVGTVILAYVLLQEAPTPLELVGGILILAGIFIASRAERR